MQGTELFCFIAIYATVVFLYHGICVFLVAFTEDLNISLGIVQTEVERANELSGPAADKARAIARQSLHDVIAYQCYLKELSEFN